MICDKCGLDFSGKLHLRETCLAEVRRLYEERAVVRDAQRIEARKARLEAKKHENEFNRAWAKSVDDEFESYRESCQILVERINELETGMNSQDVRINNLEATLLPPEPEFIVVDEELKAQYAAAIQRPWYQTLWNKLKRFLSPPLEHP